MEEERNPARDVGVIRAGDERKAGGGASARVTGGTSPRELGDTGRGRERLRTTGLYYALDGDVSVTASGKPRIAQVRARVRHQAMP